MPGSGGSQASSLRGALTSLESRSCSDASLTIALHWCGTQMTLLVPPADVIGRMFHAVQADVLACDTRICRIEATACSQSSNDRISSSDSVNQSPELRAFILLSKHSASVLLFYQQTFRATINHYFCSVTCIVRQLRAPDRSLAHLSRRQTTHQPPTNTNYLTATSIAVT